MRLAEVLYHLVVTCEARTQRFNGRIRLENSHFSHALPLACHVELASPSLAFGDNLKVVRVKSRPFVTDRRTRLLY